jgi:3-phosphoshikimate 1-carboxyvinyltransferase
MISALLMAGPYARGDVFVEIRGQLVSEPYVAMTMAVMADFGVEVISQTTDAAAKYIVAAAQRYRGREYPIEPDASNASYFLAAPAVAGGRITVRGLGTASVQGDARFVDVLERMGCTIERGPTELTVHGPHTGTWLRGIDIDLNDMPDMAQTLAVVALFAEGPTRIRNVANLRLKETDRLAALACELGRLGATVEVHADGLTIDPPPEITPAAIDTYNDHRMAMSFALAGLGIDGIVINDPGCVSKTFPDFFERWERMVG